MASQSFRDIWAHMPAPAESLAILVGFAELTIFGLAGLANPSEFARGFGIPLSSTRKQRLPGALEPSGGDDNEDEADPRRTQKALVAAIAARNIQNGAILLALACYLRDRRALGVAVASGLIVTAADTLIVRVYGNTEMIWGHVFGMLNSAVVGWFLLR